MQVSYVFHLMRYTVRVACAWCTVCIVHCVHCAGFPFSYCVHGVCIVHCVHCAGFFYILAVQVFLFMLCAGFRFDVQCLNVMCMFPLLLLCRVSNYFTMLCMIPLFFVHGFLLCACPGFLFTYLLHRVSCSAVVQGFLINYVIVVLLNSCGGISH